MKRHIFINRHFRHSALTLRFSHAMGINIYVPSHAVTAYRALRSIYIPHLRFVRIVPMATKATMSLPVKPIFRASLNIALSPIRAMQALNRANRAMKQSAIVPLFSNGLIALTYAQLNSSSQGGIYTRSIELQFSRKGTLYTYRLRAWKGDKPQFIHYTNTDYC